MTKHEAIPLTDLKMKAHPSCAKCGSSNVLTEAFVKWNERLGEWRINELLDGNQVCGHCGQDTEIKWSLQK